MIKFLIYLQTDLNGNINAFSNGLITTWDV